MGPRLGADDTAVDAEAGQRFLQLPHPFILDAGPRRSGRLGAFQQRRGRHGEISARPCGPTASALPRGLPARRLIAFGRGLVGFWGRPLQGGGLGSDRGLVTDRIARSARPPAPTERDSPPQLAGPLAHRGGFGRQALEQAPDLIVHQEHAAHEDGRDSGQTRTQRAQQPHGRTGQRSPQGAAGRGAGDKSLFARAPMGRPVCRKSIIYMKTQSRHEQYQRQADQATGHRCVPPASIQTDAEPGDHQGRSGRDPPRRPSQIVRGHRAHLTCGVEEKTKKTEQPDGRHQYGRDVPAPSHGHAPPARYSSCLSKQVLPRGLSQADDGGHPPGPPAVAAMREKRVPHAAGAKARDRDVFAWDAGRLQLPSVGFP